MFTETPPPNDAAEQTQPGVPVDKPKTSLKLTPERESWLVQLAIDLIREEATAMGRMENGATQWGSFLGIRKRNQDTHDGQLQWRADEYGGVFAQGHNWSRGKSKEIERLMSAKLTDDLLGTTPAFGVFAARAGDPDLVKNVEAYVQEKINQARIPQLLREAISIALIRNEAVLSARYEKITSRYIGDATVAVDPDTNQPIKTKAKGFYIYENDDFVRNPAVDGEMILKKDPSFTTTTQLKYVEITDLPQELVQWDGLRGAILDNRDFICPASGSIHEGKFYARLFDEEWSQMKARYLGFDTAEAYFTTNTESAARSPVQSQGEQAPRSNLISWVNAAEVYIRCDADDDGSEEEILLTLDMKNEKAIYYDYLANHYEKRPNEVLPGLRKEPGRWYGVGVYSETFDANMFIDLMLNRVNKKESQTGTLTGINPKGCKEWERELPVTIGGPEHVTLNPGVNETDNPLIVQYHLTEVSDVALNLSNTMAQDLAVTFGVSSAASASALDLNRSDTATGNAIMEREGNLIVKESMKTMVEAITAYIEQCVTIILENMDPTELFLTPEMALVTLNRDEIRTLEKQVTLLLTKTRSAEGLATSQQAMTLMLSYLDLDPRKQQIVRSTVIDQLKMMEVQDADKRLPEVTDEEVEAWRKSQSQSPPIQPNESISIKLADLLPGERAQALQKVGIIPGSDEELALRDAKETATDLAKKQPRNVVSVEPEARTA